MDASGVSGITLLLRAWSTGDEQALNRLTPLVYRDLYRTAQRYMAAEKPGHILQNTALVNETYLQLARLGEIDWQDRGHFFAMCARVMRHVLAQYARDRLSLKGGGGAQLLPLDESLVALPDPCPDLVALDDALGRLAALDERKSQVVELRVFVGLSVEEIANLLKISEGTVKRDWRLAKAWLLRELNDGNGHAK